MSMGKRRKSMTELNIFSTIKVVYGRRERERKKGANKMAKAMRKSSTFVCVCRCSSVNSSRHPDKTQYHERKIREPNLNHQLHEEHKGFTKWKGPHTVGNWRKKTEKKNESKPKTQRTTERIKSGMKLTRACEMAKYRENGTHTHTD